MLPLDLVVRGGHVLTPEGLKRMDVAVREGRFVAVEATIDPGAAEVSRGGDLRPSVSVRESNLPTP